MPLVISKVARFSVVGNLFGQDCVNVLDVDFDGFTNSREETCFTIAGDILNNWSDHILPIVSAGYEAREVRWVDLDSLTGSTGSRSSTSAETWPSTGGLEANTLPNSTYAKITKRVEGKNRAQRNGTLRLGGIVESMTTGANANQLDTTSIGTINTGFENLKDGINGITGGTANLCVVHTVDGEATGKSQISTFACQSTVGTLRRRMPGYGS